jgi:hypothetical protein
MLVQSLGPHNASPSGLRDHVHGYCFGSVFNQTNSVYYDDLLGYDYGESATFLMGRMAQEKVGVDAASRYMLCSSIPPTPTQSICLYYYHDNEASKCADQYHVDEIRADPQPQPGPFW